MQRLITIIFSALCSVLFFLGLTSCKDESNPAQQYGNTLVQGYKSAQNVEQKANLQQLQKAVYEFQAANGRYPADLKELEDFAKRPIDTNTYAYDLATGVITTK